jgi:hypothetical protein
MEIETVTVTLLPHIEGGGGLNKTMIFGENVKPSHPFLFLTTRQD